MEFLFADKSATLTTTVSVKYTSTSDSTTNRHSKKSAAEKQVEKKQDSSKPRQSKAEGNQCRSTTSPGRNDRPVIQRRASNQVTSAKRFTQTNTSSPVAKTTATVAPKSDAVGRGSKNNRTPTVTSTIQVKADGLLKTASDKLAKLVISPNYKPVGKQQLVKSTTTGKSTNPSSVRIITAQCYA